MSKLNVDTTNSQPISVPSYIEAARLADLQLGLLEMKDLPTAIGAELRRLFEQNGIVEADRDLIAEGLHPELLWYRHDELADNSDLADEQRSNLWGVKANHIHNLGLELLPGYDRAADKLNRSGNDIAARFHDNYIRKKARDFSPEGHVKDRSGVALDQELLGVIYCAAIVKLIDLEKNLKGEDLEVNLLAEVPDTGADGNPTQNTQPEAEELKKIWADIKARIVGQDGNLVNKVKYADIVRDAINTELDILGSLEATLQNQLVNSFAVVGIPEKEDAVKAGIIAVKRARIAENIMLRDGRDYPDVIMNREERRVHLERLAINAKENFAGVVRARLEEYGVKVENADALPGEYDNANFNRPPGMTQVVIALDNRIKQLEGEDGFDNDNPSDELRELRLMKQEADALRGVIGLAENISSNSTVGERPARYEAKLGRDFNLLVKYGGGAELARRVQLALEDKGTSEEALLTDDEYLNIANQYAQELSQLAYNIDPAATTDQNNILMRNVGLEYLAIIQAQAPIALGPEKGMQIARQLVEATIRQLGIDELQVSTLLKSLGIPPSADGGRRPPDSDGGITGADITDSYPGLVGMLRAAANKSRELLSDPVGGKFALGMFAGGLGLFLGGLDLDNPVLKAEIARIFPDVNAANIGYFAGNVLLQIVAPYLLAGGIGYGLAHRAGGQVMANNFARRYGIGGAVGGAFGLGAAAVGVAPAIPFWLGVYLGFYNPEGRAIAARLRGAGVDAVAALGLQAVRFLRIPFDRIENSAINLQARARRLLASGVANYRMMQATRATRITAREARLQAIGEAEADQGSERLLRQEVLTRVVDDLRAGGTTYEDILNNIENELVTALPAGGVAPAGTDFTRRFFGLARHRNVAGSIAYLSGLVDRMREDFDSVLDEGLDNFDEEEIEDFLAVFSRMDANAFFGAAVTNCGVNQAAINRQISLARAGTALNGVAAGTDYAGLNLDQRTQLHRQLISQRIMSELLDRERAKSFIVRGNSDLTTIERLIAAQARVRARFEGTYPVGATNRTAEIDTMLGYGGILLDATNFNGVNLNDLRYVLARGVNRDVNVVGGNLPLNAALARVLGPGGALAAFGMDTAQESFAAEGEGMRIRKAINTLRAADQRLTGVALPLVRFIAGEYGRERNAVGVYENEPSERRVLKTLARFSFEAGVVAFGGPGALAVRIMGGALSRRYLHWSSRTKERQEDPEVTRLGGMFNWTASALNQVPSVGATYAIYALNRDLNMLPQIMIGTYSALNQLRTSGASRNQAWIIFGAAGAGILLQNAGGELAKGMLDNWGPNMGEFGRLMGRYGTVAAMTSAAEFALPAQSRAIGATRNAIFSAMVFADTAADFNLQNVAQNVAKTFDKEVQYAQESYDSTVYPVVESIVDRVNYVAFNGLHIGGVGITPGLIDTAESGIAKLPLIDRGFVGEEYDSELNLRQTVLLASGEAGGIGAVVSVNRQDYIDPTSGASTYDDTKHAEVIAAINQEISTRTGIAVADIDEQALIQYLAETNPDLYRQHIEYVERLTDYVETYDVAGSGSAGVVSEDDITRLQALRNLQITTGVTSPELTALGLVDAEQFTSDEIAKTGTRLVGNIWDNTAGKLIQTEGFQNIVASPPRQLLVDQVREGFTGVVDAVNNIGGGNNNQGNTDDTSDDAATDVEPVDNIPQGPLAQPEVGVDDQNAATPPVNPPVPVVTPDQQGVVPAVQPVAVSPVNDLADINNATDEIQAQLADMEAQLAGLNGVDQLATDAIQRSLDGISTSLKALAQNDQDIVLDINNIELQINNLENTASGIANNGPILAEIDILKDQLDDLAQQVEVIAAQNNQAVQPVVAQPVVVEQPPVVVPPVVEDLPIPQTQLLDVSVSDGKDMFISGDTIYVDSNDNDTFDRSADRAFDLSNWRGDRDNITDVITVGNSNAVVYTQGGNVFIDFGNNPIDTGVSEVAYRADPNLIDAFIADITNPVVTPPIPPVVDVPVPQNLGSGLFAVDTDAGRVVFKDMNNDGAFDVISETSFLAPSSLTAEQINNAVDVIELTNPDGITTTALLYTEPGSNNLWLNLGDAGSYETNITSLQYASNPQLLTDWIQAEVAGLQQNQQQNQSQAQVLTLPDINNLQLQITVDTAPTTGVVLSSDIYEDRIATAYAGSLQIDANGNIIGLGAPDRIDRLDAATSIIDSGLAGNVQSQIDSFQSQFPDSQITVHTATGQTQTIRLADIPDEALATAVLERLSNQPGMPVDAASISNSIAAIINDRVDYRGNYIDTVWGEALLEQSTQVNAGGPVISIGGVPIAPGTVAYNQINTWAQTNGISGTTTLTGPQLLQFTQQTGLNLQLSPAVVANPGTGNIQIVVTPTGLTVVQTGGSTGVSAPVFTLSTSGTGNVLNDVAQTLTEYGFGLSDNGKVGMFGPVMVEQDDSGLNVKLSFINNGDPIRINTGSLLVNLFGSAPPLALAAGVAVGIPFALGAGAIAGGRTMLRVLGAPFRLIGGLFRG